MLKSPPFLKGDLGRFFEALLFAQPVKIPPNPPFRKGGNMKHDNVKLKITVKDSSSAVTRSYEF